MKCLLKKKLRSPHSATQLPRRAAGASRRLIRQLRQLPNRVLDAGSIVLAIIAAAVIVGLGVALSARSFGGLLGSIFGGQSDQAREAAELGAARVRAALMQERNRGLLSVSPSGTVSWTSAQLTNANNPCAVNSGRTSTPDLTSIANGGATGTSTVSVTSGTTAPVVYVSNTGNATVSNSSTPLVTAPANTRYAYQLDRILVPATASWTNPPAGSPSGTLATPIRGQLRLIVKGYSYNISGQISGSAVVDKTLEVVPKCCNLSLGGNNNSAIGNDQRNCNAKISNPAFGLIFGTDLAGDASVTLTGKNSAVENYVTGLPISPLVCRSSTTSSCPTKASIGSGAATPVVSTGLTVKEPEQYQDAGLSPANPTATGWSFSSLCTSAGSRFFSLDSKGLCTVNLTQTTGRPASCGVKTNDQVTEIAPITGATTTRTFTTIHCNVSSLTNKSGETWRFVTSDTHRLKLHFPGEGTAIGINGSIEHCEATGSGTCIDSGSVISNPLLRLSFLGCPNPGAGATGCPNNSATSTPNSSNSSNTQTMTLTGNSTFSSQPYFMYMPIGDIQVNGSGSSYALSGAYWVNTISGKGQVEIGVPGSGIGDILNQYSGGSGGSDSDSEEAGAAPAIFEYTLRAVQQFFFRPGA